MATKSPPKNASIKFLLDIQDNNYLRNGIDYEKHEVDRLLWERQQKMVNRLSSNFANSNDCSGRKYCSFCKRVKDLIKDFHIDKSKLSGRRSHCKNCRKKTPF